MSIATKSLIALTVLVLASSAFADGMIVPTDPGLRVRGSWAVKYHHVDITVRDQVASVAIDQEFVNTGRGMIEVEYLFPVPPDAAIDSMTLVVNGKEFAARLLPADEARKIYEDIVRTKKDPALLEYAGFGLYRTRAFPLEPGKPAKVLVTYKNVCKKNNDLVEVWYPLNTEKFSSRPIEDVTVTVDIKTAADISAVYSPTHDLVIKRQDARRVIATYSAQGTTPATDFQLFYKSADEAVGATLLSTQPRGDEDGYFLMLVSPNTRAIQQAKVAKDVVVVLDRSGSMSGQKLRQAKDALRFVLDNLGEEDRFNVVTYSDDVECFFEKLVPAHKSQVEEARDRVDSIDASGGTNIDDSLVQAMGMFGDGKRPGYIIFMTDGQPTVGRTGEEEIVGDSQKANPGKVRLFAFGVGYDVNVRLLDKLTQGNHGQSDYVKPAEPIEQKISSLYNKIKNPVMTQLAVKLEGLRVRDTYPRELGDLFEGDQILVAGRYDARDVRKLPSMDAVMQTTLVVTGVYQGKERAFEYPVTLRRGVRGGRFAFVEKIWAIRRVGYLVDQIQMHGQSQELLDELVRLSKAHGILTPYTSFLADERNSLADTRRLREEAGKSAEGLTADVAGPEGQRHAMNKLALSSASKAPAPSAPGQAAGGIGWSEQKSYEDGKRESVANVRQAGEQSLFRRGKVWIAPSATHLEPERDKAKIQVVDRFTPEYFNLVRANSTAENQVLASQNEGEELLIELRGQAYLVR